MQHTRSAATGITDEPPKVHVLIEQLRKPAGNTSEQNREPPKH